MGNGLKTAVLLGALTGLLVGLVMLSAAPASLIALVFAGVMNFVAYWFSDKLALRWPALGGLSHGKSAPPRDGRGSCDACGIPKPKVFVIQNESPNAFARPGETLSTRSSR